MVLVWRVGWLQNYGEYSSAGRIPNGASVERTVPNQFAGGENIILNLHTADFTNAKRVAQSINDLVGPNIAQAQDSVSISVQGPKIQTNELNICPCWKI